MAAFQRDKNCLGGFVHSVEVIQNIPVTSLLAFKSVKYHSKSAVLPRLGSSMLSLPHDHQ